MVDVSEQFFADSSERLRYQHEFALSGFKSLILINGGAIISLLTYVGNYDDKIPSSWLRASMATYVIGLVLTPLAYLLSYQSQSLFMAGSFKRAVMVRRGDGDLSEELTENRIGMRYVNGTIVAAVLALAVFIAGSVFAVLAIT